MRRVCDIWKRRGLTLMGKIMIINSLCASLFVYKLQVLPQLTRNYVLQFTQIVQEFLWNGGRSKIAIDKLCNAREYGGLKLINIFCKDQALKCQWIAKAKEFNSIKILSQIFLPAIGQDFWLTNIKPTEIHQIIKNEFWASVAKSWFGINHFSPEDPTWLPKCSGAILI